MNDINTAYTRLLLKLVMADIRPLTSVQERKSAWVYHFERDHWEFHGPDSFYWHGSADNAYDARAKGWSAWRENLSKDHDDMVARHLGVRQRADGAKACAL